MSIVLGNNFEVGACRKSEQFLPLSRQKLLKHIKPPVMILALVRDIDSVPVDGILFSKPLSKRYRLKYLLFRRFFTE